MTYGVLYGSKIWGHMECFKMNSRDLILSPYEGFVLAPAEGLLAALTRLLASLAKVSLTIMREIIPCIINMISNTMFETCSTLLFVPLGGKSWVAVLFIAV